MVTVAVSNSPQRRAIQGYSAHLLSGEGKLEICENEASSTIHPIGLKSGRPTGFLDASDVLAKRFMATLGFGQSPSLPVSRLPRRVPPSHLERYGVVCRKTVLIQESHDMVAPRLGSLLGEEPLTENRQLLVPKMAGASYEIQPYPGAAPFAIQIVL
jgi:hypothetical protein